MTDHEIDLLVAGANPIAERDLRALDVRAGEQALRDELQAMGRTPAAAPAHRTRRARPRLRPRVAVVALTAAAAVVLAFAAFGDHGGPGSPDTAWAAPLVHLAESSPRLLLGDEDWTVTRADEYPDRQGEMSFEAPGGRSAGLFWRAGTPRSLQEDRAMGAALVRRRQVLGRPAQVAQYAGRDGRGIADFTAIWPDDDGRTIEVRANTPDLAAFERLLATVRRVDVDAWLSALPASTIKQANRAATVDAMLRGIPLPPGFDKTAVQDEQRISDRYQLGAAVAGSVACAWVERWAAARHTGDDAKAAAAVVAMSTAKDWPILREMAKTGAFPQFVAQYADAMAHPDRWKGRPLTEAARDGLGCGAAD